MPEPQTETPKGAFLTFEQLRELLAAESASADRRMLEMIKEIKKPSPEEQEKMDKEKALKARAQQQRIAIAEKDMRSKAEHEARCSHKKEKGESAVFGQRHSDGMVHPICVRCQHEFPPYKPRAEEW
jgi:hypothetical protein